MWKKSIVLCLSLLFACCSPPLVFSQSATPATWDSFDSTLAALKVEIENLNSNLVKAQDSLTQSRAELNTLKGKLLTQSIRLDGLESSLKLSKESLATSEARLQKTSGWLFFSLLANVAFIGGTVYFALR